MKKGNVILKIFFGTIGAFALSYVCAAAGNVNDSYPTSLALKYSEEVNDQIDLNYSKDFDEKDLDSLEIETVSADLAVERGEADHVSLNIQGRFSAPNKDPEQIIKYKIEGRKLLIKTREAEQSDKSFFRFNMGPQDGMARLRLPASIKNVVIKTVSGDVGMQKFELDSLAVKTVSGDFNSDTISSKNADFKTVSGDFHLIGSFDSLGFQSISGDLDLGFFSGTTRANISSTSGDVKLKLTDAPDLTLNFSSVSGELEYDPEFGEPESESSKQSKTFGRGTGSINVKTISGDVSVARQRL
ncbi:MAG: DUF4097 family beta strand repeat protein [Bdellovibrionaceae bacterium]|nr:DUF4097 family beta strand repeat protein [Pseudobdellovibrionaceae bacterium]